MIKNKRGGILTEETGIMTRWKEYYQELLSASQNLDITEENVIRNIKSNKEVITIEELKEVINELKNGKSPGKDKITAEMIFREKGGNMLLIIYSKAWREEQNTNRLASSTHNTYI